MDLRAFEEIDPRLPRSKFDPEPSFIIEFGFKIQSFLKKDLKKVTITVFFLRLKK